MLTRCWPTELGGRSSVQSIHADINLLIRLKMFTGIHGLHVDALMLHANCYTLPHCLSRHTFSEAAFTQLLPGFSGEI